MNYFFILIFIIIMKSVKKVYREVINPIIALYAIWILVIILHSMNLHGLYSATQRIYTYIYIGLFSFAIGYFCTYKFRKKYKIVVSKSRYLDKFYYKLRYELFYILGIICIIYFLKNFLVSIILLFKGNSFDFIRVMAQDKSSMLNNNSFISKFIYNFIVLPSTTTIEVVSVVDFWFGKRDKKLFIINIIIIFMRIISDGGRTPLFNFVLYMIICYSFMKKNIKRDVNKRTQKKKIRIYGILGVIFLVITTILRSGSLLLRHLYFYFAMSPYLFNYWANIIDENKITSYGTAAMNGYVFTIFYFIKNLFRISYPKFVEDIYNFLALTDSTWPIIAQGGTKANAYVSIFLFFYMDGRVIGIIIGMFLYGVIATSIYLSAKKSNSIKSISLYVIICQGIVFSFIRFPFSKIYYALSFLMILYLSYIPVRKLK